MKKAALFLFAFCFLNAFSQTPQFRLIVLKKDGASKRVGTFTPSLVEPGKKSIDPRDPGASAHLSVLVKDNFIITANTDSLRELLNSRGSFVYLFQNTDLMDSSKYLSLVIDSTTISTFLARVRKVRKREWELYRIVIQPRYFKRSSQSSYAMYIRFQNDLLTINLPNKSNRENLRMKSISPSIPLIHLGDYDSSQYNLGPGISFNIGLIPTRPILRFAADFIGPISIEWMFQPINSVKDIFAIRGTALGVFFNSGYGIFHWGFAFYTLNYSRAEAFIGINLVPIVQLWNTRGKQRYRW